MGDAEEEAYNSASDEDYVPSDGEDSAPTGPRKPSRSAPQEPKALTPPPPEEPQESADDLWADFLAEAGEKPKDSAPVATTSASEEVTAPKTSSQDSEAPARTEAPPVSGEAPKTRTVEEIFQFAGEEVRVSKEVADEPTAEAAAGNSEAKPEKAAEKRPRPGGLASLASSLSKAPKLSTLSKSKLDWDAFKASEGLAEELETHNRGRDGFLARQDFLHETDLRQFDRERNAREKTRKNPFS